MGYLGAIKALLGLASSITTYLNNKKLIEAGEAKAIAKGLESATTAIDKARNARRNTIRDFDERDGVCDEDDPNLRD